MEIVNGVFVPPSWLKYHSFHCLLFVIIKVMRSFGILLPKLALPKEEEPEINVHLTTKTKAGSVHMITACVPIKLWFEVKHMNEQR